MKIIETLEKARKLKKMSDAHLASVAGVTRQNVRKIMTGDAGCTLYTAYALASALGYELKLVKKDEK